MGRPLRLARVCRGSSKHRRKTADGSCTGYEQWNLQACCDCRKMHHPRTSADAHARHARTRRRWRYGWYMFASEEGNNGHDDRIHIAIATPNPNAAIGQCANKESRAHAADCENCMMTPRDPAWVCRTFLQADLHRQGKQPKATGRNMLGLAPILLSRRSPSSPACLHVERRRVGLLRAANACRL